MSCLGLLAVFGLLVLSGSFGPLWFVSPTRATRQPIIMFSTISEYRFCQQSLNDASLDYGEHKVMDVLR